MTLYEKLKGYLYLHDNRAYAGFDQTEKVLYLVKELSGSVLQVYRSLNRMDDTDYTLDDVTDACEQFYTDYVRPIDLPINDYLESLIDSQLPTLFAPLIEALSDMVMQHEVVMHTRTLQARNQKEGNENG